MIRARFKANLEDYRPICWPIKHPYWCTGYCDDYAVLIAYADNIDELQRLWPDAIDIDVEEVNEYSFSSRFPKPKWMDQNV
jgi:hypothetical protein